VNTKKSEDNIIAGYGPVRVAPVQLRSTKRVSNILDAAAAYVSQNGYETLTTAAIAETSGASIGTIYRYFPDRLAMLQTLAGRNQQRALDALRDAIRTAKPSTLSEGLDVVFDCMEGLFRQEPGYRSIRAGDPIDIRPVSEARMGNQELSQLMIEEFSTTMGMSFDSKGRLALETGFEALDALLVRAFLRVERGDKAILAEARRIFHLIVADAVR
jgi:AcrR family transcriptional regulator